MSAKALREKILSGCRPKHADVPIQFPNGDKAIVRIKPLNGTRCLAYQDACPSRADAKKAKGETPAEGDDKVMDDNLFLALTYCCFDVEDGELIFEPSDAKMIAEDIDWQTCVKPLLEKMIEIGGRGEGLGKSSAVTDTTLTDSGSPVTTECQLTNSSIVSAS